MILKNKLLVALLVLAVLDTIIPIPFTALLLVYVVLDKPSWFKDFLEEIYKKKSI